MVAYTMGARALTESANQFKEVFLKEMVRHGKISKEQQTEMNQYVIIVSEKGFLGKIWDKLWSKDSDAMQIVVVKIISEVDS
jgi:polyhydroxyalkanoate synthesis regulator phasin